MIATLCFVIFFTFKILLPITTKHNQTLIMPNILGLYIDDAKNTLDRNKLNYKILENNLYTFSYPANSIIEQNPISDSVVKTGRTVYLKINPPQPPLVKIPRLIDKSIRNVYSITQSLGVKIGKIFYVTDIADNVIINAYIDSKELKDDQEVALETVIDLVVGVNKLETEIPNFTGTNGSEIELRLLENKLKLGNISFIDSDNVDFENGIVIKQSREKGYVRCGTIVDIVLEKKEKPKVEEQEEITESTEENNEI